MTSSSLIALCLVLLAAPEPVRADNAASSAVSEAHVLRRLDAPVFFDRLVERYRGLAVYRDLTNIVQIMRDGSAANGEVRITESQMICDLFENELRIITPGSQLREALRGTLGLEVRLATAGISDHSSTVVDAGGGGDGAESDGSEAAQEESRAVDVANRYRLWLAPHMALKFADDPLAQLRHTAPEPFKATEASAVAVDDRIMVHVELKSGRSSACPSAPDDFDARFDLYVNPESMLIERIEGRERLPDGGSIETTYTIQPIVATAVESSVEPVPWLEEPLGCPQIVEPAVLSDPADGSGGAPPPCRTSI